MSSCYIVPIYDKDDDFDYGYELVGSAVKYSMARNVYFVFSSYEQKDKFFAECEKRFSVQPGGLVLEDDLRGSRNPVTIKKWYGIRKLMDRYDYIAAIDCETVFVRDAGEEDVLEAAWREETYLAANRSVCGAAVVKRCAEALGLDRNETLRTETKEFRYTWWFNEIPVYRTADLDEFFRWIEDEGWNDAIYSEFCCFDYIVYVFWLLLYKGKHLKRYGFTSNVSVIEALWQPEITGKIKKERILGTHWTSRVDLQKEPINPNIYLQFHRDRRHRRFRSYLGRVFQRCFIRTPEMYEKYSAFKRKWE